MYDSIPRQSSPRSGTMDPPLMHSTHPNGSVNDGPTSLLSIYKGLSQLAQQVLWSGHHWVNSAQRGLNGSHNIIPGYLQHWWVQPKVESLCCDVNDGYITGSNFLWILKELFTMFATGSILYHCSYYRHQYNTVAETLVMPLTESFQVKAFRSRVVGDKSTSQIIQYMSNTWSLYMKTSCGWQVGGGLQVVEIITNYHF